jgi:hypothetical protein
MIDGRTFMRTAMNSLNPRVGHLDLGLPLVDWSPRILSLYGYKCLLDTCLI